MELLNTKPPKSTALITGTSSDKALSLAQTFWKPPAFLQHSINSATIKYY